MCRLLNINDLSGSSRNDKSEKIKFNKFFFKILVEVNIESCKRKERNWYISDLERAIKFQATEDSRIEGVTQPQTLSGPKLGI